MALKIKNPPVFEHYDLGEEVYYKHGKENKWKGPGKIIGLDNKIILIRQGRFIISTSQSRVLKSKKTVNMQIRDTHTPHTHRQNTAPIISTLASFHFLRWTII